MTNCVILERRISHMHSKEIIYVIPQNCPWLLTDSPLEMGANTDDFGNRRENEGTSERLKLFHNFCSNISELRNFPLSSLQKYHSIVKSEIKA